MLCRVHVSSREVQSFVIAAGNVVLVAGCPRRLPRRMSIRFVISPECFSPDRYVSLSIRSFDRTFCETSEINALCQRSHALWNSCSMPREAFEIECLCHFVFRNFVITKNSCFSKQILMVSSTVNFLRICVKLCCTIFKISRDHSFWEWLALLL